MIRRLLIRLLTVSYHYENPLDRQRAVGLLYINWALGVGWLLSLPTALMTAADAPALPVMLFRLATPVVVLLNYRLIQIGNLRLATWFFTGYMAVIALMPLFESISGTKIFVLVIPLLAAGVLLSRTGVALVIAAMLGGVTIGAVNQSHIAGSEITIPSQTVTLDFTLVVFILVMSALMFLIFRGNVERFVAESVRTLQQVRRIGSFNVEVEEVRDEAEVLDRAINLLRRGLGYPFAQIYLLDPESYLVRRVFSGAGVQASATEDAVIHLSDRHLISDAGRVRETLTVQLHRATGRETGGLLGQAVGSAAVPMTYGQQLLGVVNVQNGEYPTFSEPELEALRALAQELATALAQARTVESLRRTVREQTETISRMQSQLLMLQRRSQQIVATSWLDYLEGRGQDILGFDIEETLAVPVPASDVPETLLPVLERGEVHTETRGQEQIISVPINLRGETLGAMTFAISVGQEVTPRQIEMASIVAERLGLALENTRLYEQSQAQALRERTASDVAQRLIGATDVRTVVRLAAESFNEALGAIHTRVYLHAEALAGTDTSPLDGGAALSTTLPIEE